MRRECAPEGSPSLPAAPVGDGVRPPPDVAVGRAASLPYIAVSVGLLAAFVALAVAVRGEATDGFDARLLRWVQGNLLPPLAWLWQAVSWPGYTPQLIGAVAILAFLAWRYAGRRGLLLTLAASLSWPLGSLVKRFVVHLRPTPESAQVIGDMASSASFPSGHVVTYTAICGIVALLIFGARAGAGWARWRDNVLAGVLVALVLLIGPSRVALGQHWPTDALGGYLLGGALLALLARWRHGG